MGQKANNFVQVISFAILSHVDERLPRNTGFVHVNFHWKPGLDIIDVEMKKMVNGTSVMSFPEGTRLKDGNLTEFKRALDL